MHRAAGHADARGAGAREQLHALCDSGRRVLVAVSKQEFRAVADAARHGNEHHVAMILVT
ncbi:MAG TPA: hypothetical protein VFC01_36300 [Mycobacterium sp.]|nr:hypothetical protein [Mycobacterium sp.]